MDISTQLAQFMERLKPWSSNENLSISRNGHSCRLPVWVGFPVSLDPRTYRRANTRLLVQCEVCSALWGVTHAYDRRGPDLVWFEWRLPRWVRSLVAAHAVTFNADIAYQRPNLATIDWSDPPRKPNGMPWHRIEFPELLGDGPEQCPSTTATGHGKINDQTNWTTHRCLLRVNHDKLHEALSKDTGVVGWSHGIEADAAV